MASERRRAFLDATVLVKVIRGDGWSMRLFSPEVEKNTTYVVNSVVLQELLLASAGTKLGTDIDALMQHFEVMNANVLSDPEALAHIRQLRNRMIHTNDLLILGSARECDILLTYDATLLKLGNAVKVLTATPEQFLRGLGVSK